MNAIGIALVWCVVQVTLIGILAAGLYLVVRRLRPAAAASVVFTSLAIVVVLSLMAVSPWPRWTIHQSSPRHLGERPGLNSIGLEDVPFPTDLRSVPGEGRSVTVSGHEPVPAKSQPSVFTLLWQTLLDELTRPQPPVSPDTWHWPAAVALLLLATMIFGLGWLMLGVLAVRGERMWSRPVLDRELLELVDVLRAELACRRPVEVRQSDDLVTAATIGWRRPLLLLPPDWTTWTAAQRRAVLAHEIAHARSHDFLALLFGQLGLVLHFYHPLLHWLMNRLRLEQELAADAAAASISGGQWKYLTTIAELALHQQDRPLLWPARTFLPTQTTFLRRIAMLRNSKLRFDRLSSTVRVMAVGAVLLCGLFVAGLRGPAGQQVLADDSAKAPQANVPNTIVEGIGWKGIQIGATREELIEALGKADNDSTSDWLKWKSSHHIECTFHGGDKAAEVRFNPGFKEALANGLKLGSPGGEVLKLYGEPEHVIDRGNGAKEYEYSQKGILFWTYQGKITQIVVFKPYNVSGGQPINNPATHTTTKAGTGAVTGPALEAIRKQVEALGRTAEAGPKIGSVHIVAEMRTPPQDNFSAIGANYEFVPIDIWKQFGDKPKWRVEKPARVAVMDGDSTVMLIQQQTVVKFPRPAPSAFDNWWLVGLCNSKEIITQEFRAALAKGWDVKLADETSATGEKKVVATIEAKSRVPENDYMRNKFFGDADMRLVYRFDAKTARLEGFDAYLHHADGDVKVFTIGRIEYDQPIDPKVFALEIPKTAQEYKEPQRLPDNEKYEKMTPVESARAFFEACGKEDWNEAGKFYQSLNDNIKKYLGGLELVHLGEPFKPAFYAGWMVPYEIKFKDGHTKKWNLAVRNDNPAKRYVVDGGL